MILWHVVPPARRGGSGHRRAHHLGAPSRGGASDRGRTRRAGRLGSNSCWDVEERVMSRDTTPDSHAFPTRSYDLVRSSSSPSAWFRPLAGACRSVRFARREGDHLPVLGQGRTGRRLRDRRHRAVRGVRQRRRYGARYNTASDGRVLGPLMFQKGAWGACRLGQRPGHPATVDGQGRCGSLPRRCQPGRPRPRTSRAPGPRHTVPLLAMPRAMRPRSLPATTVRCQRWPASFVTLARSGGLEQARHRASSVATRPRCCSCSPMGPTWRTRPAPAASAATSGA